jgi:ferritin-like metal-binding protein YciE
MAYLLQLVPYGGEAVERQNEARGSTTAMPMTTPRDLFIHELSDALSAEQQILKMLPELLKESQIPEVQQAYRQHEQETQHHVQNLQTVFEQLGEKPEATTCFAVKGIAEEHQALHKERPSADVLEMANLGGADRTEHYEMAMYTGLIQMAKDLGQPQAAQLLQQNLDQEMAMAKRVEAFTKTLGKQMAGVQMVGAAGGGE